MIGGGLSEVTVRNRLIEIAKAVGSDDERSILGKELKTRRIEAALNSRGRTARQSRGFWMASRSTLREARERREVKFNASMVSLRDLRGNPPGTRPRGLPSP